MASRTRGSVRTEQRAFRVHLRWLMITRLELIARVCSSFSSSLHVLVPIAVLRLGFGVMGVLSLGIRRLRGCCKSF